MAPVETQRRRSADHVVATAFVWHHLVALLAEREGVVGLVGLRAWLARPARRSPRRFPLPRERRRELPDRPGVYRLLRVGGAVLYVGKAASLRQRVSGHFHAHAGRGECALEMLTQVREVSRTETETALEAALLEADEVKRLAVPLRSTSRWRRAGARSGSRRRTCAVCSRDRIRSTPRGRSSLRRRSRRSRRCAPRSPSACPIGPRSPCARAAVGVEPAHAPGPGCFAAGLARFVDEHGSVASARGLLQLGARLWTRRRAATVSAARPDDAAEEAPPAQTPRRPAWDAERVTRALEETVVRAAHAVRRARWRPMRVHEVSDASAAHDLEREIRAAIAAAPPDVVLQVRVPEALAGAEALSAARLRALAPPTANVTVSVRLSRSPGPVRPVALR